MNFTLALMIAVSYWGARDVQVPCHPVEVHVSYQQMATLDAQFDDAPPTDKPGTLHLVQAAARADIARCAILAGPELRYDIGSYTRHALHSPDAVERELARDNEAEYCQDIVHEVGHLAGLSHAYGGVMRAVGGRVPWGCRHPRQELRRIVRVTRRRQQSARA